MPRSPGQRVADGHLRALAHRHPELAHDPAGNEFGLAPELTARFGELDVEGALVGAAAVSRDEACRFEALEQRRERGRLEQQRVGDVADFARAALPEGEHHEVLRVGESEGCEHRTIERDDLAGCDGQSKTSLAVEREWVSGHLASVLSICGLSNQTHVVAETQPSAVPVYGPGPARPVRRAAVALHRDEAECPLCGQAMELHTFDHSQDRHSTRMHCPVPLGG